MDIVTDGEYAETTKGGQVPELLICEETGEIACERHLPDPVLIHVKAHQSESAYHVDGETWKRLSAHEIVTLSDAMHAEVRCDQEVK